MPLTQTNANNLANASMGGAAYVAPTSPMKVALTTTIGTATVAGTEVVNAGGSTYARQTLSITAASGSTAGSNSAALTYANMPAIGAPGVQGVDIYDSAGAPVRGWTGGLVAAKTTNLGDTFSIAINALTYQLT